MTLNHQSNVFSAYMPFTSQRPLTQRLACSPHTPPHTHKAQCDLVSAGRTWSWTARDRVPSCLTTGQLLSLLYFGLLFYQMGIITLLTSQGPCEE